jgi:beta-phosphoglucomutase
MVKLSDFSAFIFDLDGLVLDTEPTYFAAWQQTVESMGFKLEPALYPTLTGFHYQRVKRQLQSWLGNDFDLEAFDTLGKEIWRGYVKQYGIAIKPGVVEVLDYAENNAISICLATNSLRPYAEECLAAGGLSGRFPLMVTGSDLTNLKPAPDIFLRAAELLENDIRRCVIFEDSPTGIQAAAASGGFTVFVPSILPPDAQALSLCHCLLNDLTEVFG